MNFNVQGLTADAMGASVVPLKRNPQGSWSVDNRGGAKPTADIKATFAATAHGRAVYHRIVQGQASPAVYCPNREVYLNRYYLLRVGEVHRWDGSTATFHYNHTADSTMDVAIGGTNGSGWSIEGSTDTANSTDSAATVVDKAPRWGRYLISKYHEQEMLQYYGGNPYYQCYFQWMVRDWIGGLAPGMHNTDTLDGRCNTVPTQYCAPYGPGDMSRSQMTSVHYGWVAKLGTATIGGRTGYTDNIGWNYHLTHTEFVCGENGHTAPGAAPLVAVGPRW